MKLYFDNEKTDLTEMAQVGKTTDNYEIFVNTRDGGNIPHFHYRDEKEWDKFHTCICIQEPKYFHHTGKEDILNTKQKKELIKFLAQPCKHLRGYTNFEAIIAMWNMNNSNMIIDEDTPMPDYTKL